MTTSNDCLPPLYFYCFWLFEPVSVSKVGMAGGSHDSSAPGVGQL